MRNTEPHYDEDCYLEERYGEEEMTDEEKAEEYMHKKGLLYFDKNSIYKVRTYYMYKAYLDGLAAGRKELEQWKQEWQDAQIKANEEGFERTILQIKYLELEKENAELKQQIENYQLAENESVEIIAELKAMFEFVCKQRFGYAWNMNKDVYIADIKKALKGEKTQWV